MNTYCIIVREITEYSIEADTQEEALNILYIGDQQETDNSRIVDWDIIEVGEKPCR